MENTVGRPVNFPDLVRFLPKYLTYNMYLVSPPDFTLTLAD